MNQPQSIHRNIKVVKQVNFQHQGIGHKAGLVLKPGNWKEYDPFLMMAEDWFSRGTFDFHPHRGMETVTYTVENVLEHRDNQGGEGKLYPGDVQLMTAGHGIIHSEEPEVDKTVHTLQLWLNLPRADKMAEPRYQDLRKDAMPALEKDGALVRVFSGTSCGLTAPTKNHTPFTMVETILEKGATVTIDIPGNYNGFIYILKGSGHFGRENTHATETQVLWLGSGEDAPTSHIDIKADGELHALLYAGKPLGEPVVAYGPFVMNTEDEIRQAYADYRAGKFKS